MLPSKITHEAIQSGEIRDPLAELTFLPMFYRFPADLLAQSEFEAFPRNPYTVVNTPHWRTLYVEEPRLTKDIWNWKPRLA